LNHLHREPPHLQDVVKTGFALDGELVFETYQLGYTHLYVPAGPHTLEGWYGNERSLPLRMQERLEAGRTYYIGSGSRT
jgi:hypothetical protein